jgi:hypothetical protein
MLNNGKYIPRRRKFCLQFESILKFCKLRNIPRLIPVQFFDGIKSSTKTKVSTRPSHEYVRTNHVLSRGVNVLRILLYKNHQLPQDDRSIYFIHSKQGEGVKINDKNTWNCSSINLAYVAGVFDIWYDEIYNLIDAVWWKWVDLAATTYAENFKE